MNNSILLKSTSFLRNNIFPIRCISVSSVNNLIQKWRQEKGLPMNPNSYGKLTDGPDYTFLDGRATPLGIRQKKRLVKQKELAVRVIQLSKEMDHAIERHNEMLREQEENRQRILSNKLKQKGHVLLKKQY